MNNLFIFLYAENIHLTDVLDRSNNKYFTLEFVYSGNTNTDFIYQLMWMLDIRQPGQWLGRKPPKKSYTFIQRMSYLVIQMWGRH